MLFTRRKLLGSAVLALLAPAARAEEPDGFVTLEAKPGALQLLPPPAPQTQIWGFGGQRAGPTLRIKLGQEIKVRLANRLEHPTSLHWRGMRLPNAIDGAAGLVQAPLLPGETREYRFTPPDAGTYFYQPLIQPHSGEQLGRGLFGAVVVEEKTPIAVDDDLVLLIGDWRLGADAQVVADFNSFADIMRQGRYGAVTSVNSTSKPKPVTQKPGGRLRLRLINAASARIMRLAFSGGYPKVIAVDGQPCDPVRAGAPHHSARPGGALRRHPRPAAVGGADRSVSSCAAQAELPDASLLEFATKGPSARRRRRCRCPNPAPNPLLPAEIRLQSAKRLDLVIEGGARKGAALKPHADDLRHVWRSTGAHASGLDGPPLFSVGRGTPVTLAFVNKTLFDQVMHVQGHDLRLLHDFDDGWEPYWRDSVIVPERKTKHVAFVADNPGKWLVCSAIQDHFANGLAAWFEVT